MQNCELTIARKILFKPKVTSEKSLTEQTGKSNSLPKQNYPEPQFVYLGCVNGSLYLDVLGLERLVLPN